nr:rRNA maturation RNase YbeY [Bacteroidia bacterium]
CLNGDILISIDRVKENAATLEIPFQEELRRVMVHGVLHLCGYKDKSPEDRKKMRAKENKALDLYLRLF